MFYRLEPAKPPGAKFPVVTMYGPSSRAFTGAEFSYSEFSPEICHPKNTQAEGEMRKFVALSALEL